MRCDSGHFLGGWVRRGPLARVAQGSLAGIDYGIPEFVRRPRFSGFTEASYVTAITFTANFATYGGFGESQGQSLDNREFRFQMGKDKQFGGFCGFADNCFRSIGVYVKPISTLNIRQNQKQNCSNTLEDAKYIGIKQHP
ncbi:hypothetical protein M9H77_35486 [Catharanthus roseus]|uniref:Uncharacterized protein n=1 Tax=Catharanthus roseus TaxID=4058 RepID=A0ACB9ZRP7_CATRO|nr:hypothetical protein M9H77_35486 [Catharanthus roseus]